MLNVSGKEIRAYTSSKKSSSVARKLVMQVTIPRSEIYGIDEISTKPRKKLAM